MVVSESSLICRLRGYCVAGLFAVGLTLMDSSHCNYQRSSGHHTSQLSGRGSVQWNGSQGREGGREGMEGAEAKQPNWVK